MNNKPIRTTRKPRIIQEGGGRAIAIGATLPSKRPIRMIPLK